ncbi:MAG: proton-conducting transporter membrane subunit, partial [Asticcacaulis sp.]
TKYLPHYAFVFLLFTMANVGLPGTSGFVGEITTLAGAYHWNTWIAFVATSGVILSAVYALNLYKRIMFGNVTNEAMSKYPDLSVREIVIFTPLIIGTIVLGVYPALVLNITSVSVNTVVATYQAVIGG